MPVVQVGIVRMPMDQPRMPMLVDMGLGWRAGGVSVPVMGVMHVDVLVLQRLVFMLVQMPLGQMQPEADRHQQPAGDKGDADRFA